MLAILLAAGKGKRMGGPKTLLDLGGRTALERCHSTLRAAGLLRLRVVITPALLPQVERLALPGAELVLNPSPERGQTSSLRCGLAGLEPADDFVLHTVDHPRVRTEDVASLLSAFTGRPSGIDLVVPSVDGRRGHPVVHAASLAAEFLALPDGSPAHSVMRSRPERVLHVVRTDPWLVRDLDEPADLADALAALARR